MITHADICSGIGGFGLGARMNGIETTFFNEIDPFCCEVLRYHFPKSIVYEKDIKEVDFTPYKQTIDILTGGFACQPFSLAGNQSGKQHDSYLFPEVLRAIEEIQPRIAILENVPGLLTIRSGLEIEEIIASVENLGYETLILDLPASSLNAPHIRQRLWIIAYSNGQRLSRRKKFLKRRSPRHIALEGFGTDANASDTSRSGWFQVQECSQYGRIELIACPTDSIWDSWPAFSPVCGPDDGIPSGVAYRTFPNWRANAVKAFGNAVVPQLPGKIIHHVIKTLL